MKRSSYLVLSCFGCASVLTGCGEGGSTGALNQTQTTVECSDSDVTCQLSGLDAPIALGAVVPIDVHITSLGSSSPPLTLMAAEDAVLSVDGDRIVGAGPGVSALMFVTPDQSVVDFLHLFVVQPTDLLLYRGGAEVSDPGPMGERVQVLVGDDFHVSAVPHQGGQALLGELPIEWTLSSQPADEEQAGEVLTMLDEGFGHERRLVARTAGTGVLVATSDDFVVELEVEVLP